MRTLLTAVLLLFLVGCGYRPASHYTAISLGDSIYTNVAIPASAPEYAVAINDAVRDAVVTRFKARIAKNKESATGVINISGVSHSIGGIQVNAQGITTYYRATVTLSTSVYGDNFPRKSFSVRGMYDFPADTTSSLSEQRRLDATKEAARKALDELISLVAIRSI